jgi:NADPH:quinone reductase-like Zn-dependent oxidoreductase
MSSVPSSEMLSITVPSFSKPSGYQLTQSPKPVISAESDVVIKVHAASINPIDVKKADGVMKMILKER